MDKQSKPGSGGRGGRCEWGRRRWVKCFLVFALCASRRGNDGEDVGIVSYATPAFRWPVPGSNQPAITTQLCDVLVQSFIRKKALVHFFAPALFIQVPETASSSEPRLDLCYTCPSTTSHKSMNRTCTVTLSRFLFSNERQSFPILFLLLSRKSHSHAHFHASPVA